MNAKKGMREKINDGGPALPTQAARCCSCGCLVTGNEAIPAPDPYACEISGDETPIIECDNCRHESFMDI